MMQGEHRRSVIWLAKIDAYLRLLADKRGTENVALRIMHDTQRNRSNAAALSGINLSNYTFAAGTDGGRSIPRYPRVKAD